MSCMRFGSCHFNTEINYELRVDLTLPMRQFLCVICGMYVVKRKKEKRKKKNTKKKVCGFGFGIKFQFSLLSLTRHYCD